ncbi:MAG: putative circadian clock protein KaiC [Bradyrhizobium sp.]|nr:putative circadian clock protein KaiC [Bradyrhizobium sp.]
MLSPGIDFDFEALPGYDEAASAKMPHAWLCTATSKSLIGGERVSEQHISTLLDSIILLRYIQEQET